MSKPLLFIPSPRDIPEFKEATAKLKLDKLWMKYYPQEEAYVRARQWFLDDSKYTHIIILPDDLLVTQEILDMLLLNSNVIKVISGWCGNTVRDNGDTDSNISIHHLPPDPPHRGMYEDLHFEPIPILDHALKVGVPIIEVKHQGFALTVLDKEIMQHVPFRTSEGCCVDSCLSLDLYNKHIPQFVDLRARSYHMRTKPDILQVGKKEPEMIFEAN